MQCRGEWKLARVSTMSINHEYQPCVYNTVFRNACISGELPLAPTATRCILRGVFYAVYFTRCILRDVFYAVYFTRCILRDVFYAVYFTRCILYAMYFICDVFYMYVVCIRACVFCVLTIVENYVDL